MMRLLVTGGRDFADRGFLDRALDRVHAKRPITVLIHGAARGADRLADDWAFIHSVETRAYAADWEKHGRRAGPIRNQLMIDKGRPDGAVAFPGGRGTADMVERLLEAGIKVWDLR